MGSDSSVPQTLMKNIKGNSCVSKLFNIPCVSFCEWFVYFFVCRKIRVWDELCSKDVREYSKRKIKWLSLCV